MEKRSEVWIEEYKRIRPLYEEFGERLKSLLKDFMDQGKIKYQIIEARAKSPESFKEKLNRAGKFYKNPLQELLDLAGLRIIVYYVDDIDKVSQILGKEFKIDDLNSIDKRQALEPDQLGYLSVHKVISLNEARKNLPEWKIFKDFKAEIQIRTILQHAWAAISHTLQYKREEDIPKSLRRKLFRLSGLLELADEDFVDLRVKQASLEQEITEKLEANDFNIPLNLLTLGEYIAKSILVREIVKIAGKCGFRVEDDNEPDLDLLSACSLLGLRNIEELDKKIKEIRPFAEMFFKEFFKEHFDKHLESVIGDAPHIMAVILIGAYLRSENPEDIRKRIKWNGKYVADVLKAGRVFENK
jgi:ppGpp synthetase/RelA/SpoT-type nucleotidyltranferase